MGISAFQDTSNILPKKDPNTPWPAPTQPWMHHPQAFAIAIPAQENVAIRPPHVSPQLQQSPSKESPTHLRCATFNPFFSFHFRMLKWREKIIIIIQDH